MNFEHDDTTKDYLRRVKDFMDQYVYPNEELFHQQVREAKDRWDLPPILEELKAKAKAQGLWNLFLPKEYKQFSPGLSNLQYAPLAEQMGRVQWASEVFNCSAPDTGNMEVLARYGTPELQEKYLKPLLAGEIRSAYAMTEPLVASSDATNIETRIERQGDHYVINGRKWWISGTMANKCKLFVLMGKTDPSADRHSQQSQIIVDRDTPGIHIKRHLEVFGYDHAPHGHAEIIFENVKVPAKNLLLGEGRGFEISQGRLGPGRIHHCMRLIGLADRALEKACKRLQSRVTFGKRVSEHSVWEQRVAEARIEIEQTRLLVLKAADMMDRVGNKIAAQEIAMIKVAAPRMACRVVDMAIQAHGGGGVTTDFGLAAIYASARTLRIADGPDEVHCRTVARLEFGRHAAKAEKKAAQ
jgi:alkylation response protein AidB-like acyl-CoA dehydrogenase